MKLYLNTRNSQLDTQFTMKIQSLLIIIICSFCACNNSPDYVLSEGIPQIDKTREAKVLSAFFGLDNALPKTAIGISPKAPGKDGMPLIFSHELEPSTLDASDFSIKTSNGKSFKVDVVTFKPAVEAFELRTVLLIGDYGDAPDNEPVEVRITGELLARSGQNFKGQKVTVTPLSKGPFLSYAEHFTIDDAYPYVKRGKGCDCPKNKTTTVVRTVWAGGVRAMNGEELGENELNNFEVVLVKNKLGKRMDTIKVQPYLIADTDDNDNNIDLCIKEKGVPVSVSVKANTAIDPRDDANDFTEIEIVNRW